MYIITINYAPITCKYNYNGAYISPVLRFYYNTYYALPDFYIAIFLMLP